MKIGLDIDGVLANFCPDYQSLFITTTGRDTFQPGDAENPPSWDWPDDRGYTAKETSAVWERIKTNHAFWLGLGETPHCSTLRMMVLDLMRNHDLYYITARPGVDAKWQTEQWLRAHLFIDLPTVLISSEKGLCARALKLDVYIDDNWDNVEDVLERSPETRTYLLNRRYNAAFTTAKRVETLGQMFDAELDNL